MEQREPSGWAVGWTFFAAFMMIMMGIFHAIAGFAGILEDEFISVVPAIGTSTQGDVYFLQFDATTWGWIHLIMGIVVALAGFALFSGAVWARTIGVIIAFISAIANFAWLPYSPVWSIIVITLDVLVIYALMVHGRELASA